MKLVRWLIVIGVCAWAGQYALALVLPNLVMETVYALRGKSIGYNQFVVNRIPDEASRSIVRPSPDLLYAACLYDLKDGPLAIETPIPERYWSLQFYQMNTDNYAGVTNQRAEKYRVGSTMKMTLISRDDDPANYRGTVIQSPTERGIALLRASAIGDRSAQQAALDASRCGPIDKVAGR